jgi:hypothetical protein
MRLAYWSSWPFARRVATSYRTPCSIATSRIELAFPEPRADVLGAILRALGHAALYALQQARELRRIRRRAGRLLDPGPEGRAPGEMRLFELGSGQGRVEAELGRQVVEGRRGGERARSARWLADERQRHVAEPAAAGARVLPDDVHDALDGDLRQARRQGARLDHLLCSEEREPRGRHDQRLTVAEVTDFFAEANLDLDHPQILGRSVPRPPAADSVANEGLDRLVGDCLLGTRREEEQDPQTRSQNNARRQRRPRESSRA